MDKKWGLPQCATLKKFADALGALSALSLSDFFCFLTSSIFSLISSPFLFLLHDFTIYFCRNASSSIPVANYVMTSKLSFFQSPGRDSPGDESSASIATVESVSSGCRNSTTSLDSGRASNSNSNSDSSLPPASVTTFHTIHEHRPMITVPPQQPRLSSLGSSFRQSYHSSTSSLGSMDRAMHEDSICALDINEMLANGVPDQEILLAWLTDLHFEDYYDLFASAG